MTWFLRQAFLVLVAFATLALIVMMAMTAEAKDLDSTRRSRQSPTSSGALRPSTADGISSALTRPRTELPR